MTDTLYTYQCKSCKTVAVAAFSSNGGKCVRCNLCRSPMLFLCAEPVTTDEQRALWRQGIVYNPGVPKAEPLTCDTCKGRVSLLYGVRIAGVGRFCSAKCADEGVKRHEAESAKEPV